MLLLGLAALPSVSRMPWGAVTAVGAADVVGVVVGVGR